MYLYALWYSLRIENYIKTIIDSFQLNENQEENYDVVLAHFVVIGLLPGAFGCCAANLIYFVFLQIIIHTDQHYIARHKGITQYSDTNFTRHRSLSNRWAAANGIHQKTFYWGVHKERYVYSAQQFLRKMKSNVKF